MERQDAGRVVPQKVPYFTCQFRCLMLTVTSASTAASDSAVPVANGCRCPARNLFRTILSVQIQPLGLIDGKEPLFKALPFAHGAPEPVDDAIKTAIDWEAGYFRRLVQDCAALPLPSRFDDKV